MSKGRGATISKILDGYRDDMSKDVLEGIAEALWVHAYSEWGKGDRPGPDQDWYDVAPGAPSAAFQAADVIGKSLETLNRLPLGEIAWEARGAVQAAHGACAVPNRDAGSFAQGVGRSLAMESMGGVNLLGFPHVVMPSFSVSFDGQYLEWSPRDPVRKGGRDLAVSNPSGRTWYVVRVDHDWSQTYAAPTLDAAIDLAQPDESSYLEYATVEARDAGAARLAKPAHWMRVDEGAHVNPAGLTKKGERMYKAVERGYRESGNARAKEIAARTVFSAAKHGSKGLVRNPVAEWFVVRVNGDNNDTYAALSLEDAVKLANPDSGSKLEWGEVVACDGGEARLIRPRLWKSVPRYILNAVKGLVRNPVVGERVFTPDKEFGDIVEIDAARGDAKVRYPDGVEWWFPLDSLSKGRVAPAGRRTGRRNPSESTLAVGELVVTPDNEVGRVVAIDGDEAQVIHEDRVNGRGPWYFPASSLLEPHDDAAREYTEACAQLTKPKAG